MGRPPAYVFIVRHGNRLDAADKQWHLSSPTPYDPPLTYGGWQQSKALGTRIASIIRDREAEDAATIGVARTEENKQNDGVTQSPRRQRRYKFIVHSSPFLRCVQTSVAISAGLTTRPPLPPTSGDELPIQTQPSQSAPTLSSSSPLTQAVPLMEKSILRLDPFLGEWLSPDYFEHITPPPKSSLMMMNAKAELLRKEDYSSFPHFQAQAQARSTTPTSNGKLWSSPKLSAAQPQEQPSQGFGDSSATDATAYDSGASSDSAERGGYSSPVPPFAISSMEPIPAGYVTHARDQCVEIDYQWDSARASFGWGDGGMLPEEWAAMHQRFRKGLRRLVDWYSTADQPGDMVTKTPTSPLAVRWDREAAERSFLTASNHDDDADYDNVVILVSHGAGCNALVGGVTNQPVLADVPMSSLTMARRRSEYDDGAEALDQRAMSSLDDALITKRLGVPDLYELKLFASTDHLHSSPSRPSSLSSPGVGAWSRSSLGSALREAQTGAQYGQGGGLSRSNSANASLGSMRRGVHGHHLGVQPPTDGPSERGGITIGSGMSRFSSPVKTARSGSFGLWAPKLDSSNVAEEDDVEAEAEPPMTLNFGHQADVSKLMAQASLDNDNADPDRTQFPVLTPARKDSAEEASPVLPSEPLGRREEEDRFDEDKLPGLWAGTGNGGLWGAPRPPGKAERIRDFTAQKRRWTVNERPRPS